LGTTIRIFFFAYWGALFVATHIPTVPDVSGVPGKDKTLHAVAYCILAVLGWLAYPPPPSVRRGVRVAACGAFWATYAVADELLQGVPIIGRSCELSDWFADVAGVCVGLTVVQLYAWRRR